jgi:O-antigen ligase
MSAAITAVYAAPAETYAENEDPLLFKRVRTWWLLIALLLMVQENGIFTAASTASEKLKTLRQFYAPSTTLLMLTILLWTICAGLMVNRIGPTLRVMLKQKAVLAFALLAFLSVIWSQDPQLTFRKAILLFLVFGFAWLFAASYSPSDQMRLLLAAGVIVALASIAMAILLPQYGLDSGGEWKGVFGQKNGLGGAMLLLFSGLAFRPIPNDRRLLTVAIQAILPIGLIFLSQSKGRLILAVLLIAVRLYGPFLRSRRGDQLPFVLYSTVFGMLAIALGRDIVLSMLGRDSTLTGRTHEWAILVPYALKHLWLGYGYQAFWTGTGDSLHAMTLVGGAMRGADSGYLDTMLQFGLVGMAMWLIVLLVVLRNFARLFREDFVPLAGYWYAGIILATFVGSFTEGLFLNPGGVTTFIFVVACAGLRNLG